MRCKGIWLRQAAHVSRGMQKLITLKSPEFMGEGWQVQIVQESDLPAVQQFFIANPQYFQKVNGVAPRVDEAWREWHDTPPVAMPYERQIMLGWLNPRGECLAIAIVVSELLAKHVWHIGLFIVAARLHGTSVTHEFYRSLENWIRNHQAQWLRLGVVVGHVQAERFWLKQGFIETRQRHGLVMGQLVNSVRVMVKPLTDLPMSVYLEQVPRDRPE